MTSLLRNARTIAVSHATHICNITCSLLLVHPHANWRCLSGRVCCMARPSGPLPLLQGGATTRASSAPARAFTGAANINARPLAAATAAGAAAASTLPLQAVRRRQLHRSVAAAAAATADSNVETFQYQAEVRAQRPIGGGGLLPSADRCLLSRRPTTTATSMLPLTIPLRTAGRPPDGPDRELVVLQP